MPSFDTVAPVNCVGSSGTPRSIVSIGSKGPGVVDLELRADKEQEPVVFTPDTGLGHVEVGQVDAATFGTRSKRRTR